MLYILLKALTIYHKYVKLKYFVPSGSLTFLGEFFQLAPEIFSFSSFLLSLPCCHRLWTGDCIVVYWEHKQGLPRHLPILFLQLLWVFGHRPWGRLPGTSGPNLPLGVYIICLGHMNFCAVLLL